MKFLKITAAVLSFVLLTACASGQPVQTSETISETEISAAATSTETLTETTETETETSSAKATAEETEAVPADNDIAFDDELVSALADIIERHNGHNFFMYDFNRDGCPEIAFYGYDMATQYCAIYDFSSDEPSNYAYAIPGQCTEDKSCDMCIELYENTGTDEKFYISFSRYISKDDEGFIYCQDIYLTPLSGDILGGMDFQNETNRSFFTVYTKEEYEQLFTDAVENLSEYTLVEHINPDKLKSYTVYDPSPYDPSPRELAIIALKDHYTGE